MKYYRVNHDHLADCPQLYCDDGTPTWGVAPHYLTDSEALEFGNGPFRPELSDLYWGDEGTFIPDFAAFTVGVLTAKLDLLKQFEDPLIPNSKRYPAIISGERYCSLKPTTFLDLIDLNRSEFRLSSAGNLINPKTLKLLAPSEPNVDFFGITHNGQDKPFLIVSSQVKERYEELELTGLRFKPAWPE